MLLDASLGHSGRVESFNGPLEATTDSEIQGESGATKGAVRGARGTCFFPLLQAAKAHVVSTADGRRRVRNVLAPSTRS